MTTVLSLPARSGNAIPRISPMFANPNQARLIPDVQDVYGVAFRDLNQDRKPDLYLVCFRGVNRLLINQGPGFPFQDATVASGLGGNLMPMDSLNLELGTVLADFDNDGDGDVLLAGWGESLHLFRNDGQLRFTSDDQQMPLFPPVDANAAVAADVNGDGWLDLFITDEHFPNYLLIHSGRKQFIESSDDLGIRESGVSQGAAFSDVDGDGDPDLYVCNWFGPDHFYRNDQARGFTHMPLSLPSLNHAVNTNAPCFGDLDNDGDPDLIVTNRQGENFVYANATEPGDSNWVFQDISAQSGLNDPGASYGCVIADLNHDGRQDVFITNIGPNRFYENSGDSRFETAYSDGWLQPPKRAYSTGAAVSDVDDDGDLDLLVANKDTFSLMFLNPQNDSAFIQIRLEGAGSNRDAIGAVVTLYRAGHLLEKDHLLGFREVQGGGGYLSMNDLTVHFGLDSLRFADVRVRFPSGKTVVQKHVAAGRFLTVYEKGPVARAWFHTRQHLIRLTLREAFWLELGLLCLFFIMLILIMMVGKLRYRWHGATTGLAGVGFLGLAMAVRILLNPYPLHVAFAIIDGLVFLFCVMLILYSERLHQLHQDRERYRNVLIGLGNQVTSIHDDDALLSLVVDRLTRTTGYSRCCILLYNETKKAFDRHDCRGCSIEEATIPVRAEEIRELRDRKILLKNEIPDLPLLNHCQADMLLVIQREKFLGLLTLGARKPVRILRREEIRLFAALANQLAVALENNEYVRQSNEMIKKLTEAEVRETYLREVEEMNKNLDQKNQALQKLYNELKQTESQLIQSEKMASLGQLVAGISHELNNPIGFIYANLKQLKKSLGRIKLELEKTGTVSESFFRDIETLIGDAINGSQMVKTLVEHLRRFSHIDQAERKVSDIHEGLETCLMILKPQLSERIRIHRDFQSGGLLECNIGQLNQVFLNVLANAAQALPGEGDIWIHTEDRDQQCIIGIRDNGPGISPEVLSRIFDPFYTTKDVGEGTGLGLSISYAIVKQHQGEIQIESDPGKGALVILTLPRTTVHA